MIDPFVDEEDDELDLFYDSCCCCCCCCFDTNNWVMVRWIACLLCLPCWMGRRQTDRSNWWGLVMRGEEERSYEARRRRSRFFFFCSQNSEAFMFFLHCNHPHPLQQHFTQHLVRWEFPNLPVPLLQQNRLCFSCCGTCLHPRRTEARDPLSACILIQFCACSIADPFDLSLSLSPLPFILIQSLLLCFHCSRRIWFSGSECKHHNQMGCDDMGERRLHCTLFVAFFFFFFFFLQQQNPQAPKATDRSAVEHFSIWSARSMDCLSRNRISHGF